MIQNLYNAYGWKNEKKATKFVNSPLKLFFENLKNHHGNTIYPKIHLVFEINFYTFKVATTKFSQKFTMIQESFYVFNSRKHVDMWFFCFQNPFSSSNVHQTVSKNLWTLIYSTRRDPFVQNIYIYIYICLFKFWYSNILKHYYSFEFVIMVQSKW